MAETRWGVQLEADRSVVADWRMGQHAQSGQRAQRWRGRFLHAGCALLVALGVAGCRVEEHKGTNGKGDKVSIDTPLGGMHINTDSAKVLDKVGLPPYPGATEINKGNDDASSANVDMSFGSFRLRVLAITFYTGDSPDKVQKFYTGALSQYGDVIVCRNHEAVGDKKRTGQGLGCEEDKNSHDRHQEDGETELKAGSPARQHLVSFKAKDTGTRFALIALELPHGDHNDD